MDIEEFIVLDKRIDAAEEHAGDLIRESLRDRWEFGRLMLAERRGKQLPGGKLDELVEATGKSRQELGYRMQFAERYPTEDEVANALETFTSWRQVIKSLPHPPAPQGNSWPTSPPTPNKRRGEMITLAQQGKNRTEIADAIGLSKHTVRKELEREAIAEAASETARPLDWDTIPGSQRDKIDRAKAAIRRELEKEFRARLLAEIDQHRAKLEQDFAEHKDAYDLMNSRINAMRDEERRRYKEVIEVQRAKGLITPGEYDVIRSCLHPDSRLSVSDEKLAAAFRLFNDSRIRTLLVKDK